jgi:hypothetical protein
MKKNVLFVIAFLFICDFTYSQTDSTLISRLNKPIKNCEIVSYNCQELLVGYTIDQSDSINKILSIWKDYCGEVEPILRIKILMSIFQLQYLDSINKDYINDYIYKYKFRKGASDEEKYNEIYEYQKGYFDYIPLRGKFDNWTRQIAADLIKKQKPKSSEYLFCLLFSDSIKSFDKVLNSREYNKNYIRNTIVEKNYNSWSRGLTLNILSGIWIPVGKLSSTFKPSPQFGLSFGLPIAKSFRIDLGIILAALVNDKNFDLNVENSVKSANASVCVTFGGWVTKEFKLNNTLFLDAICGIGMGRIDTDLKKPKSNNDNNDSYYGIGTVDASIGANIRKIVFKRNNIGLNLSYHFVPYSLDKILVKDFGNQFTSLSLIYRF